MSSAFEISPTPSKSHQRAVTDKIQCLLGTKHGEKEEEPGAERTSGGQTGGRDD